MQVIALVERCKVLFHDLVDEKCESDECFDIIRDAETRLGIQPEYYIQKYYFNDNTVVFWKGFLLA